MKIKKNFSTGILIGIGVVVVPLVLMGTTSYSSIESGNYQISTTTFGPESNNIYETIIDTKTGKIVSRKKTQYNSYY